MVGIENGEANNAGPTEKRAAVPRAERPSWRAPLRPVIVTTTALRELANSANGPSATRASALAWPLAHDGWRHRGPSASLGVAPVTGAPCKACTPDSVANRRGAGARPTLHVVPLTFERRACNASRPRQE